ncbi:S41 family peptidase [Haliscomenobacter sp.]|uniref:S41 family peptidase n=1 Tax=Haliscomenobacter sp. TaxID=2717303 RepID=UPI003364F2D4
MKRIAKYTLWLLPLALMTVAFTEYPSNRQDFEISKNLEIFANMYKELNSAYVDELDPGKVMRSGIDAMLNNLDPFTNYIAEADIEGYRLLREGTSDNIGFEFKKIDNFVTVTEIFQGLPADKSGIKIGDQIIAVDNKDIQSKSADELDYVLRGATGTSIELTVRRPGQNSDFKAKINRQEMDLPNVPYSGLVEGDIAYVSLSTFSQDAGKNIGNAVRELRKENPNIKGVILDLRGNGGGLLVEAVNLCNVFIPRNELVVTTRGKLKEQDRSFRTQSIGVEEILPLAVLIDKNSASASEIVSGTLQDYDRGVLIGQRSYGKGLVQNTVEVGYNSRLKLTTAKYYIPSGRCIQSVEYRNGEPVDIADSRRATFKTRNGRVVLDGGGVAPDIKIEQASNIPVVKALQDQDIIFRFVTDYCKGKEKIAEIKDLRFEEFDKFLAFVQKENFIFRTESEKLLEQFKQKAGAEGYELGTAVGSLESALGTAQLDLIKKHKDLISKVIEKEIAGRYYYANGRAQIGLLRDPEVHEAIKVIRDPAQYKSILKKI